jgi:hypothetical protein
MATQSSVFCDGYTLDQVFDSDIEWVKLMNNKIVQRDLLEHVLKPVADKHVFRGSFLYAGSADILNRLVDTQTIDIVSGGLKPKRGKNGNQSVYNTVKEFFDTNPLVEGKINYYLIGDAHGTGKYIGVHWICIVADTNKQRVEWYDPSMEVGDNLSTYKYNFNYGKLIDIMNEFWYKGFGLPLENYWLAPVCGAHRAQQICEEGHPGTDVFCQSWVMMFIAAHSCGKVTEFLGLGFNWYQTMILKSWLLMVLKSMEEYKDYPQQYFGLKYCRMEFEDGHARLCPTSSYSNIEEIIGMYVS